LVQAAHERSIVFVTIGHMGYASMEAGLYSEINIAFCDLRYSVSVMKMFIKVFQQVSYDTGVEI
jgi:hypothetical protein